jgi:acyl carrier protein
MDAVELVIAVERRFKVTMPDEACSRVRTVADLAALVIARTPHEKRTCVSARTFYQLRAALVSAGVEHRSVRPGARLIELCPQGLRRAWRALRAHDPSVPRLEAPPVVDRALLWAAAIAVLASVGIVGVVAVSFGTAAAVGTFLTSITVLTLLCRASDVIGWRLPEGMETVGDVVRAIAPIQIAGGSPGERLLAQQRVLEEVRRLTAEQLGMPLEKVTPLSTFAGDLGVG